MFLLFYIVVVVFFKQELQKILFEYDKDGDGELSGQEMSKYIEDTLVGIFWNKLLSKFIGQLIFMFLQQL